MGLSLWSGQDFYAKNPGQGYYTAEALPKVNMIRKHFAEYALAS
jgi:peptide-methionine (S)-S-oxide reductase